MPSEIADEERKTQMNKVINKQLTILEEHSDSLISDEDSKLSEINEDEEDHLESYHGYYASKRMETEIENPSLPPLPNKRETIAEKK